MSTFAELDALARRATATLLAHAPDPVETDAALDAVKSGVGSAVPTTSVTRTRASGRMPLLIAGAAAAVIAVGIAGVITVTRPDSSPAGPVPTPDNNPIPTAAPLTTLPTVFEPLPGPFTLTVAPGDVAPREVLYAARVGSGDDELGMQQCGDCESERPHDPIVTSAGGVLVFDMANHRWVVVGTGPIPIDPSIDMFELQLGRDGLVYTSAKVGGAVTWSVVVWDPTDLTAPLSTIPTEETGASLGLHATDEGVLYGTKTLAYVGGEVIALGALSQSPGGALVRTYPNGTTTTWTVPSGWSVQLPGGVLDDGTAVVPVSTADDGPWLVRLFPDGTSLAMPWVQGDGVWAAPSYTLAGMSVVQRTNDGFEIARYPLPQGPLSPESPMYTAPESTAPMTATTHPAATTDGGGTLPG